MNAEEFANEFLDALFENLQNPKYNLTEHSFSFCPNCYNDDPNLKVLKKKLNENGFDIFQEIEDNKSWKVVKL